MTCDFPLGNMSLLMGNPKSSRLRELRDFIKRSGYSQETLAAIAKVSPPTFSKVLKGPRSFSVDAAGRLADFTGIPVEKLLTDREATRLLKLLGKRMNSREQNERDNLKVV